MQLTSYEAATEGGDQSEAVSHPEFIAEWRETPEQLAQRSETQGLLDEAVARLDDKHRLVFLLRDVQGLSIKETADRDGGHSLFVGRNTAGSGIDGRVLYCHLDDWLHGRRQNRATQLDHPR
jgi:hypothetical protein